MTTSRGIFVTAVPLFWPVGGDCAFMDSGGARLPSHGGDNLPDCHAPYAVHAGLVWPPRICMHISGPQGEGAHRHPLPCRPPWLLPRCGDRRFGGGGGLSLLR